MIRNTRSSIDPFLTYSDNRDLREKVWKMFISRGDNGDAHDNNADHTADTAAPCRAGQALGFATHAHWTLEHADGQERLKTR